MMLLSFALATSAAFAGAAAYINLSEQKARLSLDDVACLKEWKPSYARGLEMQATLAVVSGLLGFAAFYVAPMALTAIGGLLMLANWPYTLILMAPTNKALNAIADHDAGPRSRALIETWGRLHAARTALGLAASGCFLWAMNVS